jgi:hypothetical protein
MEMKGHNDFITLSCRTSLLQRFTSSSSAVYFFIFPFVFYAKISQADSIFAALS